MYSKLKYYIGAALLLMVNMAFGQRPEVEMADGLRASGKIYVVVLVAGIIFAGIVVYLIIIDRKVRKLEKEIEQ